MYDEHSYTILLPRVCRRSLYSIYRHLQSSSRHLLRRRHRWLFDTSLPLSSESTLHQTPFRPLRFFTTCTVIDTPLNFSRRLFQGFAHHWLLAPSYVYDQQRKTLCGEWNDFLYGSFVHSRQSDNDLTQVTSRTVSVYFEINRSKKI